MEELARKPDGREKKGEHITHMSHPISTMHQCPFPLAGIEFFTTMVPADLNIIMVLFIV